MTKELVAKVYLTAWEYGRKRASPFTATDRAPACWSTRRRKRSQDGGSSGQSGRIPAAAQRLLNCPPTSFASRTAKDWISFVGICNDRPTRFSPERSRRMRCSSRRKSKRRDHQRSRTPKATTPRLQYKDKYGYTNTIGGISRLFDEEFGTTRNWISGVLRNGMPILDVVTLIESLHLNSESINTWKRRGTCAETIHCQWNQSQREVSELRTGNLGLSEQLSGLHELRLLQMRITGPGKPGLSQPASRGRLIPAVLERAFVGRHPETAPFPGLTGKNGNQHTPPIKRET